MDEQRVYVSTGFCIFWAVMLLVLPLRWLLSFWTGAVFHELCHWLTAHLCGGRVLAIRVGVFGAEMEITDLSPAGELLCAMAGPLGSLGLGLLFRWIPCIAVVALVQCFFNLLPVYPLDGGRILRCIVGERAEQIVSRAVSWVILAAGCAARSVPLLAVGILLLRKIPCKSAVSGLQ